MEVNRRRKILWCPRLPNANYTDSLLVLFQSTVITARPGGGTAWQWADWWKHKCYFLEATERVRLGQGCVLTEIASKTSYRNYMIALIDANILDSLTYSKVQVG